MYQGFLQMAGVEIINAERTKAYIDNVMPTFPLANCVECGTLHLALRQEPYTSPIVDDAPWFDPTNPATGRFFGLYPLEFENFEGSTTTGTVVESIGNGGFVNGVRKATRGMRVHGVLVGENEDAVASGLVWLKAALDPAPCSEHGGTCGGSTICYYSACPVIEDCYDMTGGFGTGQVTGPITPESSPLVLPRPNFDARLQGVFVIPQTDGTIFEFGQLYGESSKEISHFGPFISQRTNYVNNPSFTKDLRDWDSKQYPDGSTQNVSTNFLANPNFGAAALDWTALAGGVPSLNTTDFVSSPSSMQVVAVSSGDGAICPAVETDTSLRADRPVTVSFSLKAPAGSAINADLIIVDGGVETVNATGEFTTDGTWQRVQFTGHNPLTNDLRLSIYSNQASGVTFLVDDAMIQNGAAATVYFDGNTPDDDNFTYDWTDAANASQSTKVISTSMLVINENEYRNPHFRSPGSAVGVRSNYVPNPNFETNTTGWHASSCTVVSEISSEAAFGTRRALLTATSNSITGMNINTDQLPVTAGNSYTISAYKMSVGTSIGSRIRAQFFDSGGSSTGTVSSEIVTADRERMIVTVIPPATSTTVIISLATSSSVSTGDQIAFDGALMENGELPGNYFDGSFAPEGDFTFVWNGTVNNSISRQMGFAPAAATTSGTQGQWFQNHFDGEPGASFIVGQGGNSSWGANLTVALTTGKAYTIVTRFRTTWNGNVRLRLNQAAGSGETSFPVLAGQWQTIHYTAVNPGSSLTGFVGRPGDGSVRGDQLDVQYAAIVPVPDIDHPYTGDYFDGDTPSSHGVDYTWTGTPDNSISLASGDIFTFEREETGGVDGGPYARLFSAFPSIQLPRYIETSVNGLFGVAQASFALRSSMSTRVHVIIFQDGSDAIIRDIDTSEEWERFNIEVANGRNASVEFYSDYGDFDVDQVMFEQAHSQLDYFDGDTPGLPIPGAKLSDYTLSWLGEPDLSPSRWIWNGTFFEKSDEPGGGFAHTATLPWTCGTDWRPFIGTIEGSFATSSYLSGGQTRISNDEQAARFERSYHEVTVTSGPSVIRDYKLQNGAAKEIEFFMTAGSPAAYGATKDLDQFSPLSIYPSAEYNDVGYTRMNYAKNPKIQFISTSWFGTPGVSAPILSHGGPDPYIQNYLDVPWSYAYNTAIVSYGINPATNAQQGTIPVTPGQWYSWSMWVKTTQSVPVEATIQFPSGGGGPVPPSHGETFYLQAGQWQRIALTSQAPEAATVMAFSLQVNEQTDHIYATGAVATDGRFTVLPYFDGGMTDTDAYTYSWESGADFSASQVVFVADCPVDPSDSPIVDPNCPQPPPKPTAPSVDNSCVDDPTEWLRYYLKIYPEDVAAWSQTLPTVTINSAYEEVRSIRVRFFANPFGRPPEDIDPCSYCAEFILSYLPAEAALTVDGTVERAYASVAGGPPQPASNLLYGTGGTPMTWPSLSCGVEYAMTIDVPTTAPDDLTLSLALTSQE